MAGTTEGARKGVANRPESHRLRLIEFNKSVAFRAAKTRPTADRFWEKVEKRPERQGGCWVWTGAQTSSGYGRFFVSNDTTPRMAVAHRWAYEDSVGPVAPGLDLDHLCRTRLCVRPDHLEPVTRQVNLRRGVHNERRKVSCPRGHPYDTVLGGTKPSRACSICRREQMHRYWIEVRKPKEAAQRSSS